jgi:hypothetical protein
VASARQFGFNLPSTASHSQYPAASKAAMANQHRWLGGEAKRKYCVANIELIMEYCCA